MKTRSVSAVGVVIVGLVPGLLGSWIFAIAFGVIMIAAWFELSHLVTLNRWWRDAGIIGLVAAVLLPLVVSPERAIAILVTATMLGVASSLLATAPGRHHLTDWAVVIGTFTYLAFPACAAIALRMTNGTVERRWFAGLAEATPGGEHTAIGLGLFLLALLVTWMSDTCAYLVGRSMGRIKLIPHISPNKTVEGAAGGLIAAGLTAVASVWAFGLPTNLLVAFVVGVIIGVAGIVGDLFESMLKRSAGVKDSGHLIPGHGGVLDRIDALVFALLAVWALSPLLT